MNFTQPGSADKRTFPLARRASEGLGGVRDTRRPTGIKESFCVSQIGY